MNMPLLSPPAHRAHPISRPLPRFGSEGPQDAESVHSHSPSVDQVDLNPESQEVEQPDPTPVSPSPFALAAERIARFFNDLSKALNRLFNHDKPKTPLDLQLKSLKHNLRQKNFNEEALHVLSESVGQFNQKLEAPETQNKALHALAELPGAVDRVSDRALARGPFAIADTSSAKSGWFAWAPSFRATSPKPTEPKTQT